MAAGFCQKPSSCDGGRGNGVFQCFGCVKQSEIVEKGNTISIKSSRKLPFKDLLVDAGFILILVWGVFTVLVVFFSQAAKEIVLYFTAISLLLIIPLVTGILIRESRQFQEILFDGENGMLSLKGLWRRQQISFNNINAFQIHTYHSKRGTTLYRFEAALSSGRILRLIQDVPDKEALSPLSKKVGDLAKKSFHITG